MTEDPTPGERQPRRRRPLWRWTRRLALAVLALVGLLALAYGLRERWLAPLANRLLARYRDALGAEVTVERVSGDLARTLVLEGVTWRGDGPPLIAVEDARIELDYSLRELLAGAMPDRIAVQARGIEVAIERAEDEPATEPFELPVLERIELDLADVRVHLPDREPLALDTVRAAGALLGDEVRVDALEVVAAPNRIALADATLRTDADSALGLARSIRGELTVALPEPDALGDLVPPEVPLRSAELVLDLGDGRASVAGRAALEGGTLEVERGELVWPEGAALEDVELDLELDADFADLAPLEPLVGRPLAGRWAGSIDVSGPLGGPTGRFVGRGSDLVLGRVALDTLDVDVRIDGERARFERFEAYGPALDVRLRGDVVLDPLELDGIALDLVAGHPALAGILPFAVEELTVHARLSGPPTAPRGAFEAGATAAAIRGVRIEDAEVRGELDGDRIEVDELRLTSADSAIEAAGTLERDGEDWTAELRALALERYGVRVEMEEGARIAFGPGRVEVSGLELVSRGEDGGGIGRARIDATYADGIARGTATFTSYDAAPLLAPVLPEGWRAGTVHGKVEGEYGGAEPALGFELALGGWAFRPDMPSAGGTLRGGLRDGRIALDLVDLELGDRSARLTGSANVPFDVMAGEVGAGPLAVDLALEAPDLVRALRRLGLEPPVRASGPVRAELELGGTVAEPEGRLAFQAEDVVVGRREAELVGDIEAEIAFAERIALERAVLATPVGTVGLVGTLDSPLELERWIERPRELLDEPLELELDVQMDEVAWIAALLPDLRRVSGSFSGIVTVEGTALAPELGGSLAWRDGEMRLTTFDTPIRAISAEIALEDDVVVVERLYGELGGAPIEVRGTVEPLGPFRRMDLTVEGKSVLLARSARLRLRADAILEIRGTPSNLRIGGELALTEGLYLGEISPLEEILRAGQRTEPTRSGPVQISATEPLASAELDVRIAGDAFEYRTNLVRAEIRPELLLRGTGAYPILEGPAYVEEASFSLPSGTMEVVSGVLQFGAGAPLRPEITLAAEMDVSRYEVRATATGTLDELEITLSSTPPLPQDDLWVLTLTGQAPAADRGSQAIEAVALFLARDTLVRWFTDGPGEGDGLLDRFEIDLGAQPSQSGQTTGRVLFYLKPRSRRTGRATYLSAEIDQYDRVNYALGIVFRPR